MCRCTISISVCCYDSRCTVSISVCCYDSMRVRKRLCLSCLPVQQWLLWPLIARTFDRNCQYHIALLTARNRVGRQKTLETVQTCPRFFLCNACHSHTLTGTTCYSQRSSSLCAVHECMCASPCFSESSVSSSSPGSGPSSPNNGPAGNVPENEASVMPPTPLPEVRLLSFYFWKLVLRYRALVPWVQASSRSNITGLYTEPKYSPLWRTFSCLFY